MEKMQEKTTQEAALRILLIEDSDTDAFVLQRMIQDNMKNTQCTRVTTLKAGEAILEKGEIDLLFLDLGLPDTATPSDTYARIKKWAHKFPIIIMTSLKDHDLARTMVHEGAADFLNKDSLIDNPGHVQQAIDFSVERHSLHKKLLSEKEKEIQDSKEEKDQMLRCFMGGYSMDSEKK